MTTPASRQPQGIPAGGQFAPTTRAEPNVALAIAEPVTAEQFSALMTAEFGEKIDAGLNGRLKDIDPETGYSIDQVFESEPDGDGGMSIYTNSAAMDESVTYTVAFTDGKAQVLFDDSFTVSVPPRTLHPDEWVDADDAAAEISTHVLDMETDVAALLGHTGTQDGFASDSDYRRWRER
jgi:hypothetical protein